MPRDFRLYLEDILLACQKVESYPKDVSFDEFVGDDMRIDAVLRNLQIIGEAVKGIPDGVREEHTHIEWRKIAGFRDIVAHKYFSVDLDIVWDVTQNKLPDLQSSITTVLGEENERRGTTST
jgi:uncharacterized protein with HEPN domain